MLLLLPPSYMYINTYICIAVVFIMQTKKNEYWLDC